MDIELALAEYGLSEKEAKTYLALLPLGAVNLQEVAKRMDFPRTTVYNTLHYVLQKGLVSRIIKQGVMYFEAADPKKLVDNLEKKKRLLSSVMPGLEGLRGSIKESSHVEIYEGNKGLFTILSDVFKVKQQTYYFGSYSLSSERLRHQPEYFRTIRLERKIPAKIVIDPYDEPTFHKREYKRITEMRYHKWLKDFPCMIFIYGSNVAMYTLKGDLIGLIIKNKQAAESMKLVFDLYWKLGTPSHV